MASTHTTLQQHPTPRRARIHTTLLDLVWAVSEATQDGRLVVALGEDAAMPLYIETVGR